MVGGVIPHLILGCVSCRDSSFGRKSNCQLAKLKCVCVVGLWGQNSWTNWIYRFSGIIETLPSSTNKKIELSFAGASDLIRFGAVRVRTQISSPQLEFPLAQGNPSWEPLLGTPLRTPQLVKSDRLLGNKHKRLT